MGFVTTGIFWGVFFLIIGITIIFKTVFNINIPLPKIFFALFFIWLGIRILIGGPLFKSNRNGVVFGESRIDAENFKGTKDEYSIIFGKGTIDLSNIDLDNGNVKVNINTVFGQSLIKINPDIPAVIDIDSAFASAKLPDKTITSFGSYTYKTKSFAEDKPYLKIKIDVVFGAVDIIESL